MKLERLQYPGTKSSHLHKRYATCKAYFDDCTYRMSEDTAVSGYSHDDAFDDGLLRVDSVHQIYYAQYGVKDGLPGK